MLKPKQRIAIEETRQKDELIPRSAVKREIDRYIDETWAKNWAKVVDRLNRIEKALKQMGWLK